MKKILLSLIIAAALIPGSTHAKTLYEYFGGHLPSVEARTWLAENCDIENYRGLEQQNIDLLTCLEREDDYLSIVQAENRVIEEELRSNVPEDELLGAGYTPITAYQSRTTQFMAAGAATIPVASTLDTAGNQIVLSNVSSASTVRVYLNVGPGTSREELFVCTGVTVSSWTGCTGGLSFQGSSESTSTTLQKTHNAGTPVIITNIGQFFNQYVSIDGDQTINDTKTFNEIPRVTSSVAEATLDNELVTFYQLQQATSTGGVDASETARGVSELATGAEAAAASSTGSTGARLALPASLASSTNTGDNAVPITLSTGYLDSSFGGVTSSLATLDANSLVVQDPASATSTPTANSIPISDANGFLDSWISTLGNQRIFVRTSSSTLGDTSVETNILSTSIPGGTLSTSSAVSVKIPISDLRFNTDNILTVRMYYGGSLILEESIQKPNTGNSAQMEGILNAEVIAVGSTSTQAGSLFLWAAAEGVHDAGARVTALLKDYGVVTVDSTQDQTLVVSVQFNVNTSNNRFSTDFAIVESVR